VGKKKDVPDVPARVKVAIAVLLDQPKENLLAAAMAAGITTYRLREALKKAHVRTYLYHEKQALLDAVSAGNPNALKTVRDTSENGMAVVAAAKAIEQMRTEGQEVAGGPMRAAPGFVILIKTQGEPDRVVGPSAPPLIEHQPSPDHEYEPVGVEGNERELAIMSNQNSSLTNRDLLFAIFNAICALAERLTGERLTVHIKCEDGLPIDVYGDHFGAAFNPKSEPSSLSVPPQKGQPMPS
jgi:hypothetical protein